MTFDPKNSDPLDVYRIRDYVKLSGALNQLCAELDVVDPRVRKKEQSIYYQHIKQLALNLFECSQTVPFTCRGISLNQNSYVKHSRYNALHFSYRHMSRAKEGLVILGYAVLASGYFDQTRKRGYTTRIAPTQKIVDLFNEHEVTLPMLEPHPDKEVIILRNSKKRNIEYEDTAETNRMRETSHRINNALLEQFIDVKLSDTEEDALATRIGIDDDRSPINYNRKTLARVFNNSSFEQGGRFYGANWQNIPSEERSKLIINGKHTREVDFSGMHFVMMHAEVNSRCQEDPYYLRGFDTPEGRKKIKLIANIMVNASSREGVLKSVEDIIPEGALPRIYRNHEVVLAELERVHNAINRFFYSGYGVNMQYRDSVVAEKVMLQMIDNGVVPLTVHDSFVVEHNQTDHLKDVMHQKFEEVTGVLPSTEASPYIFETVKHPIDMSPEANVARIEEIYNSMNNENNPYRRYEIRKNNWYLIHKSQYRPV